MQHQMVQYLAEGRKTLDISQKNLSVKRAVADPEHRWVCADIGRMRKVSARRIHRIKRAAARMPLEKQQTDI